MFDALNQAIALFRTRSPLTLPATISGTSLAPYLKSVLIFGGALIYPKGLPYSFSFTHTKTFCSFILYISYQHFQSLTPLVYKGVLSLYATEVAA